MRAGFFKSVGLLIGATEIGHCSVRCSNYHRRQRHFHDQWWVDGSATPT